MVSEHERRPRRGVKYSVHDATGVEPDSAPERSPTRSKYSFPYCVRLSQAEDFNRVFVKGNRTRDRNFTVLSRSNNLDFSRLGLAISKKCTSHAVQRNRIKRLIRESFRVHQSSLPALDIIVMCQPTVLKLNNRQILDSLEKHWQRLKS